MRTGGVRGVRCGGALWLLSVGAPLRADDPRLTDLLQKAGEYVARYEADFSALVAREDYVQRERGAQGGTIAASRHLVSDVLLTRLEGDMPWTLFRDVYSVDGRPVRDREERLQELLQEFRTGTPGRNRAILNESARYNLGAVWRNFNVPTIPLAFLRPRNWDRFAFTRKGTKKLSGLPTEVIEYREEVSPTVIREHWTKDIFARGRFWLDPAEGAVVKSEMLLYSSNNSTTLRVEITVSYGRPRDLAVWVPATMDEVYEVARAGRTREYVEGTATYKNFRKFEVTTDERYQPPR